MNAWNRVKQWMAKIFNITTTDISASPEILNMNTVDTPVSPKMEDESFLEWLGISVVLQIKGASI